MRAEVNAQRAHVDRLRALENFKRLAAPFDGIVTARNTDIGALINAGSNAAAPLFKIADMHEMRVYVRVPQAYAADLKPGLHASLTEPQYPGRIFDATLETTSVSAALESRTVLVELLAPNPDGKLWPGTFANVTFDLPGDAHVLRVPASALIFRNNGAQLAAVGRGNRIVMKNVTIGKNLGTDIEIESGITQADRIVTSPLDTIGNGEQVAVAGQAQQQAAVQ
jgi:RND family efflux transporter MFP subunit